MTRTIGKLDDQSASMTTSPTRLNFNGISMGCHRADLVQQLDYILKEVDQ